VVGFADESAMSQLMASKRKKGSTDGSWVSAKRRSTTASETPRSISREKRAITTKKACRSEGREACRSGLKWWNTTL